MAGLYYLGGQLGLSFATIHESASPLWAPTGIAIAGLYLLGARAWPALFAGAFLFNLETSGDIAPSLAIAAGNTLEGLLGAHLLRRLSRGGAVLESPKQVARFVLIAAVAPLVSATIGTAALFAAGSLVLSQARSVWLTWWLGDATGALIVGPLILLWARAPLPRYSPLKMLEAALLAAATVGLALAIFATQFPSAYLTFTLVLWAALRFEPRESISATFLLNVIAVGGTVRGLGPFVTGDPNSDLLILQGFIAMTTLVGLVLATQSLQNRRAYAEVRASRDVVQTRAERSGQQLTESEARFSAFMKDLPGLAWIKDREGRYVYCNEAFADRLGRTPAGVVGLVDAELFPPETAAAYQANDARVIETRKHVATIEEQPVQGKVLASFVRKFPIHDEKGDIAHVGGVAVDITEQRAAEERLQASEALLRDAQRTARIGSWQWDLASGRVAWSDELHRLFGVEPGSIPITYATFVERVHPEDRAMVQAGVEEALARRESIEIDHRIVRPDGGIRWLHSSGHCQVGPDGRVVTMTGTGQDVTERRLSEDRFRQLLEASPDAFIIVDAQGRIVRINEQTERLFGYKRSELIGQAVEILVPGASQDRHVGLREEYVRSPKSRPMGVGRDLMAVRKDGSEIPVEISLSPLKTEEGLLVMSTIRDVSERRRAEREREELERLRQVNEFKNQFINMAAHELNTPLTPLKLQAHLLRSGAMGPLSGPQAHSAEILERNLERVANLVQNMLDVGRIQSGRIELRLAPLDLGRVVHEVVESFTDLAAQVGVRLEERITPGLQAHADAQRVSQVLFNLVSNALKFTPRGGRVLIDAAVSAREIEIRIQDNGLGLDAEQMARLFQPFSQVHDAAQTASRPGTGLGLFISRQLVQLQGGRLWVESAGPGRGSSFRFTLPAKTAGDNPASPPIEAERLELPKRPS